MKFNWRTLKREYLYNYLRYGIPGNSIRIEASTICQLKCPECFQAKNNHGVLGKGYLKYEDFKRFVDTYPSFRSIELSNRGEIFLNPELKKIIKYAYSKKIALTASTGANLNTIDEEMIKALVKYRFRAILVSIDGACNKTYQIYRRGGNFIKVIENVERINYYKDRYNSLFPILSWQFVVFGHNEHEIATARMMARDLKMDFYLKFNWNEGYSPIKNVDLVRREMGAAGANEYREKYDRFFMFYCNQLWDCPQLNWDGKLLGCCVNMSGDFGNVFEQGLEKCINSEKYIYAKQMITGKRKAKEDIPCFNCLLYKQMLLNGIFFDRVSFLTR